MSSLVYDVAIVGAGPAGVSCAVWLARLGHRPVLIEASAQVGGLLCRNPFPDDWSVIAPQATGSMLATQLRQSLQQAQVPLLLQASVSSLQVPPAPTTTAASPSPTFPLFSLYLPQQRIQARYAVLATGVSPRSAPECQHIPAQAHVLTGAGQAVHDYPFTGRHVAVLGGGDNAFENALFAHAQGASQVTIYARNVRAQAQWRLRLPTTVKLHQGAYRFDPVAKTVNGQPYDTILIFYGYQPQLPTIEGATLRYTAQGYIWTQTATAQTSIPGLYAIGEVANRQHPCVVTSLADGVVAAKAIQRCLEAEQTWSM